MYYVRMNYRNDFSDLSLCVCVCVSLAPLSFFLYDAPLSLLLFIPMFDGSVHTFYALFLENCSEIKQIIVATKAFEKMRHVPFAKLIVFACVRVYVNVCERVCVCVSVCVF